ncbi:SusC/RagA family TonB-linked outer membrane protein [Sinomicrobium kalidii]|uniref:SusC/RagA family TonB-linked outer membrane protein n=1 Tax=Sinomicrobium kalidii TaxID=2900738 RepID=UPI001E4F02A2|nr:SusC/RagA family TonB-linked outer membrane protein [Sinomicrobium kalidii]UGU17698.1 SusC/RagA family TonB-linked outer membrane protein [Sinomicrobium kalidii]
MKYILQLKKVTAILPILFSATLNAQDNDTIQLSAPVPGTDEQLVQVAFRKVKPEDVTGNVSSVDIPEILDKNYFTYSLDGMEAFAGGFNGNIWGTGEYLVLVDGIPRDAGTVLPTEIEQVTFLKGVSAIALYGSRGAKGVVYITTKRGQIQKQQIDVRVNTGIHVPKSYPEYLGSAEYMTLYNEARNNDGLSPLYSEEDIYNYASGGNPYRYPDIDYYSSDYLKKVYERYDATVEISGGNKLARYYTNIGFWSAGDLLDFGEAQNNRTQRFNIRGNVDLDLNDFISCTIGGTAIYYNGRGVNTDYWNSATTLRPHRFTPLVPTDMLEEGDESSWNMVDNSSYLIDGKYLLGGTQLDQTNPFATIYAGGYNKYTSRQFQFNTSVRADLGGLLKGLSFRTVFGVDYATSYNQSYNNNYAVYEPVWNTYSGKDQIGSLVKYGEDSRSGVQNISDSHYMQTIAFSGQFDYVKSINNTHNLSAMLIASGYQQSESEAYHRISNANLGLHLGYNYRHKYYADFNGAAVHSARLPKGNRAAFSPSLSLGWRISEEDFMSGMSAVDDLKLSLSGGILHTDLDISDYYLYQAVYTQTDGAWFNWRDGSLGQSTDSRRGENPNLTFAKRKEISFGVDGTFFNRLLQLKSTFFIHEMTGNVIQASALYPGYFTTGWPVSSFIPYVNYNNNRRVGFDFNLSLNKRFGEVEWTFGIAGMYFDTRATRRAEIYEDGYQNREGKPLDALWGLESLGYFSGEEDIANAPEQRFGQVAPGDIKYKDQNGDGIIDTRDEVYLGKGGWSGAPWSLGVHLTARWKDFTFFALATGRFGAHAMKNNSYFWMDGEDKYSEVVRGRWTEETANTATYPRLTTRNSDNNFRSSDFWMYSTDRMDLSRVQISYDLPGKLFRRSFVRELGIYVSGANLLTVAPERKLLELNVGSAPQTRYYNLGIKALF